MSKTHRFSYTTATLLKANPPPNTWRVKMSARSVSTRVAVLYQAAPPPVINNVRKPVKPGGYQDSGSDIAFNLREHCRIDIATPHAKPDPGDQTHWCFPDTESGIIAALDAGATHLWANTIVYKTHALQESSRLLDRIDHVSVVGQPPCLVELYDDKQYANDWLRDDPQFSMPRAWSLTQDSTFNTTIQIESLDLPYPIVAKPCRGRGSAGVKLCQTPAELASHLDSLYVDSSVVMLEEYLRGEEATVTVMPPSSSKPEYWAMPIVERFNHENGIAPYNGTVAVTANSRTVSPTEFAANGTYAEVAKQCEAVAKKLRVTAPIRIDVRRREENKASPFVLFDINMKPNMTGPGRPSRDDQASLTAMAAAQLGWDYPRLLLEMLSTAVPLTRMREMKA